MRPGSLTLLASVALLTACSPKNTSLTGRWIDTSKPTDWLTVLSDSTFAAGSIGQDSVNGKYTKVDNELSLVIPGGPPIKITVMGDSLVLKPMNGDTVPKVFRRKP